MNALQSRKKQHSPPTKSILLVLGSHRSGVSVAGGMLQHLGCTPPASLTAESESARQGRHESLAFREFNDKLLKSNRSNWHDWRPLNLNWLTSAEGQLALEKAKILLDAAYGSAPLVLLTDPRVSRMLSFWTAAARARGYALRPVLLHRHPLEVAKSLQKNNGLELTEGLLVWLRHMLEAEAGTRGEPRYLTSYSAILDNWVQVVTGLQTTLDLTLPGFDHGSTERIETFLDPQLRHFRELPGKISDNPTLSDWIRRSFDIFKRWAAQGENKSDYKALDRIRAEFDAAAPVFGHLSGSIRMSDHTKLQAEVETQRQQSCMWELRCGEALKQAAHHEAASLKLQQALKDAQDELAHNRSALAQRRLEADQAQEEAAAAAVRAENAEASLRAQEAEISKIRQELDDSLGKHAQERRRSEQQAEEISLLAEQLKAEQASSAKIEGDYHKLRKQFVELQDVTNVAHQELGMLGRLIGDVRQQSDAADKLHRQERDAVEKLLHERQLQITLLSDEVEALRNSSSWRITRPLRSLADQMRRLKG